MAITYFILSCGFDSSNIDNKVTEINEVSEEYGMELDLIFDGTAIRKLKNDDTSEDFSIPDYILRVSTILERLKDEGMSIGSSSLIFINTIYPNGLDGLDYLQLIYDLREDGLIVADMGKRLDHYYVLYDPDMKNCTDRVLGIKVSP